MASNPILAQDLIDDGAIQSLERLGTTLESVAKNLDLLKQAIQSSAQSMNIQVQQTNVDSQALADMEKKVEALKAALDATNKMQDENTRALEANTNARQRNNSTRQRQSKLNAQELKNIQDLEREIEGLTLDMSKNLVEIDKSNKSYNELYASYNKIKDALNKMTTAERESTNAGKSLTMAAKDIYEEMNKLQMQTGKFQMNVGNYKRAFDGLGYSITQVARELPSLAINANTFFLAISNNIPMVYDEYQKFVKQQADLKRQMDELVNAGQEQSEAFRQLESQVMTFGQKMTALLKSFSLWISLLPTLLVFLPKIVGWVKNWFTGMERLRNETESAAAVYQTITEAYKSIKNTDEELSLITIQLEHITKGTNEWMSAIERVNELCHSNLNATTATVDEVKNITDAYRDQAKQLALNKAIAEKLATTTMNQELRSIALGLLQSNDIDGLAGMLGYSQGSKEYNELRDDMEKELKLSNRANKRGKTSKRADNLWTKLLNQIDSKFPTFTDGAIESLKSMFKSIDDPNKNTSSSTNKKDPSLQEMEDRYWDMLKARAMMIEDEYKREVELEEIRNNEEYENNEIAFDNQMESLINNLNNRLITKEEYAEKEAQYKNEHDEIELGLEAEHQKKLHDIWEKYEKKRIEKEIEDSKVILTEYSKRVRTKNDEVNKNKHVNENIAKLLQQKEDLEKIDTKNIEEEEKKKQDAINETTKAIERQRNALSWSKQLANYGKLGDLIGGQGMLEGLAGGDKVGFLGMMGLDMSGASDEQVDSAFEEWMKNAGDAIVKWKDITIDNLGQMLDAYVEFYQAKSDAASEDTDKAKEAYELQKSLMEQGYANSVNTAWAEYQQKQEIQKKAEEDVKRAQQLQKIADEAQNTSNLILASSNILKQYSANPLLAGVLLSTMWGTYAAAKAMAIKSAKYEQGGYEELTGGSHASGHDINLGVMNGKGRNMVAEGGESIGIFSRKAKRVYGSDAIRNLVQSVNDCTYQMNSADRLNNNASIILKPYRGSSVSLDKIESGLTELVDNAKRTTYADANGNMVVQKGNSKTIYIKR